MTQISSFFASLLMLSLLLGLPRLSHSQTFERKVFSSGSSQGSIGLINYHFTFGEAFTGPTPSAVPNMTMGFHQPIPMVVLANPLLAVEGSWQDPISRLEWSIQEQIIGSRFVIHRAVDRGDFMWLGEVESSQQASQLYSFDDLEAHIYAGKQLWYQVSWLSPSGQTISSELVEIWIPNQKGSGWDLYPNPATDHIYIRFRFTESAPIQMRFVNPLGQIVKEMSIANATQGSMYSLSLDELAAGTYLVWLQRPNSTSTQRLVIAR